MSCGCVSCQGQKISKITLIGEPTPKTVKMDSAQDVMSAIFAMIGKKPAGDCKDSGTLKKLGFQEPTPLADGVKINDAFVTAVAEKILSRLEGKAAIVTEEKPKCGCSNGKVTYLVVKEESKTEETSKPADPAKPADQTDPANTDTSDNTDTSGNSDALDKVRDQVRDEFGDGALDGVIEDLIGPIEVAPKPKPKLI